MSFASIIFFLFLPTVFALYYSHPSRTWQNAVLLLGSYFFYGWWDYRFCGLMLFASLLDYVIGARIARARTPAGKRALLGLTLVSNLGLLGFFKYFNFFADSFALLMAGLGIDISPVTLQIVLPLGISFYTFQTLSYTIDIYRGAFQPQRDLLQYLTFVSFFPQLVAGPIERAAHLLPQFGTGRVFSPSAAVPGCRFILWGLAKKMILADNLGAIVEDIFLRATSSSGAELVVATVFFAFQIYCDFSAYSDIAVGTARLFGIESICNFAYPYFSQSLPEFWRRWHISLSSWFRDYVYIPLGGNRSTPPRASANLFCTLVLSGLWHGAAWHFIAWGALHGFYLLLARAFRFRARHGRSGASSEKKGNPAIPGGVGLVPAVSVLVRMAGTFFLVCVGWTLFRAESVTEAFHICWQVGSQAFQGGFYTQLASLVFQHSFVSIAITMLLVIEWVGRHRWNPLAVERLPTAVRWATYTFLFWSILYFGTRRSADFIYFQF